MDNPTNLAVRNIGLRDAVLLITGIVAAFGPTHKATSEHGSCTYTVEQDHNADTLTAVCIVGVLFSRLGILRALFTPYGQEGSCFRAATLWANAAAMGVTFDTDAREFLRDAQSAQDSGKTWGEALNEALALARERVLDKAKEESKIFDYYMDRRVAEVTDVPVEDPLASWERELLDDEAAAREF